VKQNPRCVMGKHSGRHAFVPQARRAGLQARAATRSKTPSCASRRWLTQEADLRRRSRGAGRRGDRSLGRVKLVSLSVIAGTRGPQRATMKLDIRGRSVIEESKGNGPVDASSTASNRWWPHEPRLSSTRWHAVTEGTDRAGPRFQCCRRRGRSVTRAAPIRIPLGGFGEAYLGALNKLMSRGTRAVAVSEGRVHSTEVGDRIG